jgi:Ca2+-transporting ATPase
MEARLDQDLPAGLSAEEAAARLARDGPNELASAKPRSALAIALSVLREPMLVFLVACGALYFVLGDREEALLLSGFVVLVIGITFVQERKTERSVEALRDLTSPRALVLRGGRQLRVPGREVVEGDVVVLSEGDRVPADGVVVAGVNLTTDESLLTGESVPVRKSPGDPAAGMGAPGGDDTPFVFSGSLVSGGKAFARVLRTGVRTEIGKIGTALRDIQTEPTPLEREVRALVRRFLAGGVALCAVVVVVFGLTRGGWLRAVLAGITLAMAMLPEEFPVVLTIFLALGAFRLSKARVLTRRMASVETLGAATVLCVDKTGTLTENRMRVERLDAHGVSFDVGRAAPGSVPEALHEIVEYAIVASQRDPFDPMELAIAALGERHLAGTEHLHPGWELVREYPLSRELLAISRVFRAPEGPDHVIAAKGAPEAIFDLCHLDAGAARAAAASVEAMAVLGLRVLGVARARFRPGELPEGQHDFPFELVGLLGLADPIRAGVPAAVEECRRAGIRVVMITGDHVSTARAIANAAGLDAAAVITGPELAGTSDEALRERIRHASVFARAVPDQKLRIVEALRAGGEVVAMTGDGVNDAPALKAAHIGVAMGGRGTDVAREAAGLVLVDDDFSSIVGAVRLGRRIYDNLEKAMAYIVAVHVPIAGLSLLPVLLRWPLVLTPVHIAVLEMIIDPACSIVFEAEPADADVMERPPRAQGASLFGRRTLVASALQGLSVLAVSMGAFGLAMSRGWGAERGRGLAFATLVFSNLALILVNRSWSRSMLASLRAKNTPFWVLFAGVCALLAVLFAVPYVRHLFQVGPLTALELGACFAAAVLSVAWFDAVKKRLGAANAASGS